MFNKKRNSVLLIILLTISALIISIPDNFKINISIGPLKIDTVLHAPRLDYSIGNLNIKKDFSTKYGLDLSGGTHLVLEADMVKINPSDRNNAFASAKNVVERRINLYGLTEPVIQQSKVGDSYRIIVEIPGISDVNKAIELIGKTAQLGFYEEASDAAKIATPSSVFQLWSGKTPLSGKNLKKSEVIFNSQNGSPEVALEFDDEGAKLFEEITGKNVGKTIAILLDDQLLSAPRVNTQISGGKAVIQGQFTSDEAKNLSISLNAGALPVPLKIIEQRNVGATLGAQTISKSFVAGVIGIIIVAIFMLVNYGQWGLAANAALIIYTILVFAIFRIFSVTLTLAGIAGFILSIGMAVDANILIFERIKEELRSGKSYDLAQRLGFEKAFPSIKDSNLSSLITCFILYWFGTGIVRGFAITLAIGIFVSLFSAITVTRTFLTFIHKRSGK